MCAIWRFRSHHLSRTQSRYVALQLATGVTCPDVGDTLRRFAQPPARAVEAVDGNGTIIHGSACPLPARVRHLYKCRLVRLVDVGLGPPADHWLPLAIDGTNRHEAATCIAQKGVPQLVFTSWQVGD